MMKIESYGKKYKLVNRFTRGLFFFIGDSLALVFSAMLAYITLAPLTSYSRAFPVEHVLIIIGFVLVGLGTFRMYAVNWKHTGLRDLGRIILGIFVGGVVSLSVTPFFMVTANYEYAFTGLLLINAVLVISGFRISKRMYFELVRSPFKDKKHTIILGGESEGEQILRDILKNNQWNLAVYAIFDDRVMSGMLLHGVRVLGDRNEMIDYVECNPVDQLIVAYPEIPKKELKAIIDEVKSIRPDINIKILPSFQALNDDPVGIQNIRDIRIEDILGREPVELDMSLIKASIQGKTVMVTGGGGSIGSELIRQCANLKPGKLIALDIDETELFYIQNEFAGTDTEVIPCVASVTDEQKVEQLLASFKPDIIFHAAAYKHVPMMERYPEEAIKVNIMGTQTIASLACAYDVDKFIMVSTDKAVNPTNVMGATKRVAEEVCMAYNGTCITKFISVRFGNVLGSRGSVVPIFIDQIKNGGPVTITDPEMKRYFMTIPEAVLLVIQAGSMGEGGEVFVLDMGEPVKILDMAKDLIRLHNMEPYRDIQIEITGIRPGEKLFEELLNAEEGVIETQHKEIFKAICSRKMTLEELQDKTTWLANQLNNENAAGTVRSLLKTIVPTYTYDEAKYVNGKHDKTDESILIS